MYQHASSVFIAELGRAQLYVLRCSRNGSVSGNPSIEMVDTIIDWEPLQKCFLNSS